MKLIMATSNDDKVKEIRQMLSDSPIDIVSLKEAGLDVTIEENGTSFEENAVIKAETIRDLTGQMVIADDSGLVIDYLDGAPGIYSSRFMGEDTPYPEKNQAILDRLQGVPDELRSARFICSMAIAYPRASVTESDNIPAITGAGAQPKEVSGQSPRGKTEGYQGIMEGRIAHEIVGEGGFGYDPIFYLPSCGCTSAQLSPEEKNAISHRGQALRKVVERLKKMLT